MSEQLPELREAFLAARRHFDADAARLERLRQQVVTRAGNAPTRRLTGSAKLWLVVGALGLTILGGAVVTSKTPTSAPPVVPTTAARATNAGVAPSPLALPPPQLAAGERSASQDRAAPALVPRAAIVAPRTAPSVVAASPRALPAPPRRAGQGRANVQPAPPATSVAATPTTAARSADVASADTSDDSTELLLDEAALIEAARAALEQGDTERASAKLREHALRHPAGQLQVERVALRTLLACKQQDRSAARKGFAQLRLLRPPLALRLSLERSCGAWISE